MRAISILTTPATALAAMAGCSGSSDGTGATDLHAIDSAPSEGPPNPIRIEVSKDEGWTIQDRMTA